MRMDRTIATHLCSCSMGNAAAQRDAAIYVLTGRASFSNGVGYGVGAAVQDPQVMMS